MLFNMHPCGLHYFNPSKDRFSLLESSHDGCFPVFIRLFLTLTIFIQIVLLYLFLPRSLPRRIFPVPHNDLCRLTCYWQYLSHFPSVTQIVTWFTIPLNTLPVVIRRASNLYSSLVQISFSLCLWFVSLVVFFVNMSLSLSWLRTNSINTVPSFIYCRTKWYLVSTFLSYHCYSDFLPKISPQYYRHVHVLAIVILLVGVSKVEYK